MPSDKLVISCASMDFSETVANRQPFSGILCTLDEASKKAPMSSTGKKAVITKAAAEKALPSLEGQPVNVTWNSPDGKFSGHDTTVIGVFSKGWVQDDSIWVEGYLFNETFPKICASIKQEKKNLGFSYEILAKSYETKGDDMVISDFTFIGGTILYKDKAAYGSDTQLVAAQAKENDTMTKEEMKSLTEGVIAGFAGEFEKISASIDEKIKVGLENISKDVEAIKASAAESKANMENLAVELAETKEKVKAAAVEPEVKPQDDPAVESVKAAATEPPAPTVVQAGQQAVEDPHVKPAVTKAELIKAAKGKLRSHEIDMNEYMRECVRINAGIEE